MIHVVVFTLLSVPTVWVSRRSLLHPRSHGFPRFFAFEAILALIVLNAGQWFVRPLGGPQLASWLLLTVSGVFVLWGLLLLRRLGGFRPSTELSPQLDWENTGHLVTTGIYRYIRHPMYSSLLLLAWGALLKSVTIPTLVLTAVASGALFATARAEEVENLSRFGQEYRDYMERTRRFIPFLL